MVKDNYTGQGMLGWLVAECSAGFLHNRVIGRKKLGKLIVSHKQLLLLLSAGNFGNHLYNKDYRN